MKSSLVRSRARQEKSRKVVFGSAIDPCRSVGRESVRVRCTLGLGLGYTCAYTSIRTDSLAPAAGADKARFNVWSWQMRGPRAAAADRSGDVRADLDFDQIAAVASSSEFAAAATTMARDGRCFFIPACDIKRVGRSLIKAKWCCWNTPPTPDFGGFSSSLGRSLGGLFSSVFGRWTM